jgi:hypothetical protein
VRRERSERRREPFRATTDPGALRGRRRRERPGHGRGGPPGLLRGLGPGIAGRLRARGLTSSAGRWRTSRAIRDFVTRSSFEVLGEEEPPARACRDEPAAAGDGLERHGRCRHGRGMFCARTTRRSALGAEVVDAGRAGAGVAQRLLAAVKPAVDGGVAGAGDLGDLLVAEAVGVGQKLATLRASAARRAPRAPSRIRRESATTSTMSTSWPGGSGRSSSAPLRRRRAAREGSRAPGPRPGAARPCRSSGRRRSA